MKLRGQARKWYSQSTIDLQKERYDNEIKRLTKLLDTERKEHNITKQELSHARSQLQKVQKRVQNLERTAVKYEQVNTRIQTMLYGGSRKKGKTGVQALNYYTDKRDRMMSIYIPQFIERLRQKFPGAFTEEQLEEMRMKLIGMTYHQAYEVINGLGLKEMYFESDAIYSDIETAWEAVEIYEAIMDVGTE